MCVCGGYGREERNDGAETYLVVGQGVLQEPQEHANARDAMNSMAASYEREFEVWGDTEWEQRFRCKSDIHMNPHRRAHTYTLTCTHVHTHTHTHTHRHT